MKFGIFYEHQLPRPWTADSEYQLFQDSLIQIELADRLGYHYALEVEHHFSGTKRSSGARSCSSALTPIHSTRGPGLNRRSRRRPRCAT